MQIPSDTIAMNQYASQGMPQIDPKLYQKQDKVKWKAIKNLEIERIIENNDVLALENFLPNIINCKISKDEFQRADKKSLAKLLQIFQLSLEYFSYTHNYLTNLKEKLNEENTEIEESVFLMKKYYLY